MTKYLDNIDHFALNVSDIPKSLRWFSNSFNCEVIYEDKSQAILQFGNIRLTLVLPSLEPVHVAISREDAQSFGELRERVGGIKSTFLSDPTGNIIEIVSTIKDS